MRAKPARRRRGTILVIVLIVVVILSLGAYTFTEFMLLEAKSASLHGQAVRARALADSGIELVSAQLADRVNMDPMAVYDNPGLYRAQVLSEGTAAAGKYTILAPVENDDTGLAVRYGLIDESSKINLNTLLKLKLKGLKSADDAEIPEEDAARAILMYVPGMTVEVADAILDFIDEDDEVREFGAESEEYAQLGFMAKNAPLDSLDELMLVQGVTPQMVFGEDANRNGLLDPNENDGGATAPLDNADGRLDRGWSSYFTLYSRERNTQADGADRIYVNNNILTDLYDELLETFDADVATFVVAYRIAGPVPDPNSSNSTTPSNPLALGNAANGQNSQQAGTQLAMVAGRAIAGSDGSGAITRGGMDLGKGATTNIGTLYDLIGVKVKATVNGATQELESPWSDDPAAMASYLPALLDKLTVTEGSSIEGRVNINQAPFETLAGLPNMTEELARAIASAQQQGTNAAALGGQVSLRATTGWLLMEDLCDLETIKKLDPYLTARGDVYRVQVVGFFDKGGPTSRVEAVIDASQETPQVLFFRDLTDLGRGYPPSLLGAQ